MPDRLRLVIALSTAADLERIWDGIAEDHAEDNADAADRTVSGILDTLAKNTVLNFA